TRDEIMQAVWGDVAVTDESVTKCIADIRKALGDESQQLIRTVARRGYVFTAPVTTPMIAFPREWPVTADPIVGAIPATSRSQTRRITVAAVGLFAVAAVVLALVWPRRPDKQELTYTK